MSIRFKRENGFTSFAIQDQEIWIILGYSSSHSYEPSYYIAKRKHKGYNLSQLPNSELARQWLVRLHEIWLHYSSDYHDNIRNFFKHKGWEFVETTSRYQDAVITANHRRFSNEHV